MHCIDGGIVKKLLSLWFQPTYSNQRFSLTQVKGTIDERLTLIKPPRFVHRMPRSVDELISHGKASELKAWLFYYSLPVLNGIMDPVYFNHYCLLVLGITLLNTNTVTNESTEIASNILFKFVRQFETLYGLQFCSINMHIIIHLPQCVRNLGPLWAYVCYYYEDLNGKILKNVHGTRHIDSQVATSHIQLLTMQRFIDELPEGPIRNFCFSRRYGVKICEKLSDSCYSVVTYKRFTDNALPNAVSQAIDHLSPMPRIQNYLRLLKKSKLYISQMYTRALQTQSSCVLYKSEGNYLLGSIYCFLKLTNCQCENRCQCLKFHYAVIQKYSNEKIFKAIDNDDLPHEIFHIYRCLKQDNFILVSVASLVTVCVEMSIENLLYVGIPVNSRESE
ncbi:uncharacterized protein LOC103572023 isoform X5 [Microplitis demolitor]|uniref:uncharacterized protein LOC103572023 isoform X5 n=1 Tax=Microplitis demolitor TaxID=69319 RepID=UPI0004CD62E1|nr:uncharacterized protein LOC103572023 isoform X5 [Microplitis demolitor]XP_014298669.1 uncharacterized protein LOC103572023 isoform X5 [Microplitis demolitor]